MKKRSGIYLATMLACFVAVFTLPQTHSLSHMHLTMLTHPEAFIEESPVKATDSGDFDAVIGSIKPTPGDVDDLLPLVARFPERKELHAHILRYACDEDKGLTTKHRESEKATPLGKDQKPPYAELLESATQGEKLDPENAFFPFMAGMIHCAQNQDDLAWKDLARATQKPHYEDYAYTETQARWNANEKRFGGRNALADMTVLATIPFPHFAQSRSFARVVLGEAQQREKSGDAAGGVALRQNLAKMGAKMRVEGRTLISNLVGMAITNIAGSKYPGAMPQAEREKIKDSDERAKQLRDGYLKYLASINQNEEARWYRAETEASVQMHNISKAWFDDKKTSIATQQMSKLAIIGGMTAVTSALLMNLLNLIVLGGIAAGLLRLPRLRSEKPLSKWAGFGVSSVLVLGTGLMSFLIFGKEISAENSSLLAFIKNEEGEMSSEGMLILPVLAVVFSVLLPYFVLISASIGTWRRKRKAKFAGEVLVNSTRLQLSAVAAMILPTAAIFSLAYLGTLLYASHNEQIAQQELSKMVQHEGQFYSRISGQPIPGAVK
jgi:hypothetical protein